MEVSRCLYLFVSLVDQAMAFKLLNSIVQLGQLYERGVCRELWVFGQVNGMMVRGVIDELRVVRQKKEEKKKGRDFFSADGQGERKMNREASSRGGRGSNDARRSSSPSAVTGSTGAEASSDSGLSSSVLYEDGHIEVPDWEQEQLVVEEVEEEEEEEEAAVVVEREAQALNGEKKRREGLQRTVDMTGGSEGGREEEKEGRRAKKEEEDREGECPSTGAERERRRRRSSLCNEKDERTRGGKKKQWRAPWVDRTHETSLGMCEGDSSKSPQEGAGAGGIEPSPSPHQRHERVERSGERGSSSSFPKTPRGHVESRKDQFFVLLSDNKTRSVKKTPGLSQKQTSALQL